MHKLKENVMKMWKLVVCTTFYCKNMDLYLSNQPGTEEEEEEEEEEMTHKSTS